MGVVAIVNWVWQGCVVALACEVMLRAAGRASAATRYALWWVALLLVLLIPALQGPGVPMAPAAPGAVVVPGQGEPGRAARALPAIALPAADSFVPLVVWGWAAWIGLSLVRLLHAAAGLVRARRGCAPFPRARERRLEHWRGLRARGRAVSLAYCPEVRRASVLGGRRPVIAVSPVLLEAMDDRELDQVVAHEWVHVQRRDDLTVVLQALARATAGFHPAVWWITRQLDFERELACDELAVRVTGSVKDYARCLTKLASLPAGADTPRLAPAASASRLASRIVRLIARDGYPPRSQSALAFSVVAAALLWLAPAAASVVVFEAAAPAPGEAPLTVIQTEHVPDEPTRQAERSATSTAASRRSPAAPRRAAPSRPTVSTPPDSVPLVPTTRASALLARAEAPLGTILQPSPDDSGGHGPPGGPGAEPLTELPGEGGIQSMLSAAIPAPPRDVTPWQAAADSGVAIGRGSQKAAVKTAGFFSQLGRRIAGSF